MFLIISHRHILVQAQLDNQGWRTTYLLVINVLQVSAVTHLLSPQSITQCKMQCKPILTPYCSVTNYLYLHDRHLMSIPDIRGQHFRL